MLNARAIAVQGVGFAPRLLAVQGLYGFEVEVHHRFEAGGDDWRVPSALALADDEADVIEILAAFVRLRRSRR